MTRNFTQAQWLASAGFFCLLMWAMIIMGIPFAPLVLALPQFYSSYKAFSAPVKQRQLESNNAKAIEAAKIDGRTQEEWYDIVHALGKDDFERLSRPALDGLDDSPEGWGAWDVKALLGDRLYTKLRMQFYPENFCDYCQREGCKESCDAAFNAKMRAKGVSRRDGRMYMKYNGYDDYDNYKYYELQKWKKNTYYLD